MSRQVTVELTKHPTQKGWVGVICLDGKGIRRTKRCSVKSDCISSLNYLIKPFNTKERIVLGISETLKPLLASDYGVTSIYTPPMDWDNKCYTIPVSQYQQEQQYGH